MLKKITLMFMLASLLLAAGCGAKGNVQPETLPLYGDLKAAQLKPPAKGEEIAVITTSMGKIKIRLFPELAPKAVENFKTLAQNGYYKDQIFHRVINNFMIQGGDPTGTGTGGESKWGKPFEDEFNPALHNLRGALSMANSGENTNGSQFFIVQAKSVKADLISEMREVGEEYFPTDTIEAYEKIGGTPWLDYRHTVFGQVFEGLNIVDAIAAVEVGEGDKPKKNVEIKKIEILNY